MFAAVALSDEQIASFRRDGWLVLRQAFSPTERAQVDAWMETVQTWADTGGPGLHHHEQTHDGPRIARSEDFVPHHEGLAALLCDGALPHWVGQLFGEPAVLYKEKCNYKYPGGGGFAPHQDASAYRFVDHHISIMVPLDPATRESGCLWVAPGFAEGFLPTDDRGCIEDEVAERLSWQAVEVYPGDVLLFDSYTPHKSDTNRSDHRRRALYLTYNAASAGDFRDRYYADKRREFHELEPSIHDERVRISVTDDFLGVPVKRKPLLSELVARYASTEAQALYDESVTELDHGLQCAALAAAAGATPSLIVAALLHDVGHLLIGDLFPIEEALPKDFKHEEVGARYLTRWFGPAVTEPIRLHVAAKRYLVAVDSAYRDGLSPSSLRSLEVQGGPMTPEACEAFAATPFALDAVALRRWDDSGKRPDEKTPAFDHWLPVMNSLL